MIWLKNCSYGVKQHSLTCSSHSNENNMVLSQNFRWFDFPIFRFWAYQMKVIPETCRVYYIWLSNLSTLSVPDEGYSRNVSCILYLTFQSFDLERTWWRLFQKRVVYTIFDFPIFRFWAYLMKVIPVTCRVYYIWLSNLSTLSVPDEGYSSNVSCILYLTFQSFDLERTWWRLFQKRVVYTIFDFPIFRPWAYLMKVIPETCRVCYIWLSNLSTLSVPDEGYSRNVSCILYLTFQSFDLEHTWWRLFQKCVVYTIFDFPIFRPWAYLMKVIPETCRVCYIWLSNLSTLSVPDEGYSRNVSCILYLTFQSFDLERTWWRLFQKRVVYAIFDFPIFRPWAYLMKVIPETCRVCYIWLSNLSTLSIPDEGYSRNVSCILYLTFQSFDLERTRWRLFQKRVVYTIFDFPIFRPWAYQMKVIPETCRVYYIWLSNLSTLSVPDEGYSRNVSCILYLTFQSLDFERTWWRLFQ